MKPRALILHATRTNRDLDAAAALTLAGAEPEIVHINQLRRKEKRWQDFQMLVIPGGFSYADALGAGRLFALDLKVYFAEAVRSFVDELKPVIGICNGFQALVKAGLLPAPRQAQAAGRDRSATLTFNACGHFVCRWVMLSPVSQKCIWTRGLQDPIYCPVAHGEGNFVLSEAAYLDELRLQDQIALLYADRDGAPALEAYPDNPNGSMADIAGICNPEGNVLGLMPHPEDHVLPGQHPQWRRGSWTGSGLPLFRNGVEYSLRM